MTFIETFGSELLVGGLITVFGLLARAALARLTTQNERIIAELSTISRDFQAHVVEDARALARIDAHLTNIYKRLDRETANHGGA